MFGSSVLEIAIGVIFIYLLLSLVCSIINEGIASIINKRGTNLFEGIKNLLNDPSFTGLAQQVYNHGLVTSISKYGADPNKSNRVPSYIPSKTFALVLLDLLGSQGVEESWKRVLGQKKAELQAAQAKLNANPDEPGLRKILQDAQAELDKAQEKVTEAAKAREAHITAGIAAQRVKSLNDFKNLQAASAELAKALSIGRALAADFPDPLANIQKGVETLPEGHTKQSLSVLIEKAKREIAFTSNQITAAERQIEQLQRNLEQWFNDAMDRISGWYKRWTQAVHLTIAVVLVFAANADTLMLAKRLTRDNALRASVVGAAEKAVQNAPGTPAEKAQVQQDLLREAERLKLPLGWIPSKDDPYKTDQVPADFLGWLSKFFGLLISVLAVSLGATFWFDTLSKFINLRGAGTPPGEPKKSAPIPAGNE